MAFLVCLLFRESIGVAITKSFVIFVRKFFVSSLYCNQSWMPLALVPHQFLTVGKGKRNSNSYTLFNSEGGFTSIFMVQY